MWINTVVIDVFFKKNYKVKFSTNLIIKNKTDKYNFFKKLNIFFYELELNILCFVP